MRTNLVAFRFSEKKIVNQLSATTLEALTKRKLLDTIYENEDKNSV